MKNILNTKPALYESLSGRTRFSCDLISNFDVNNKTIMNIGFGHGWFERYLLDFHNIKKIISTEVNQDAVDFINNNIENEDVFFKVGVASSLPAKDGSVDICTSWDVIEHIPVNTESAMFDEIHRILKKGGLAVISTPCHNFSTYMDPAFYLLGHRHYNPEKLHEIAKNSGFKMKKCQIKGGVWEQLYMYNLYIMKWVFRAKPIFESFFMKKMNLEYENSGHMTIFSVYEKK